MKKEVFNQNSMSNFRRSQSKVFYASEVWDPGVIEEEEGEEEDLRLDFTKYRNNNACSVQQLNDILEEDEEDDLVSSPSPPGSEEGSFRRLPRGSTHRSSQESSSSSSNDSNSVRRRSYVGGNHKSQDSGFSDSAESDNNLRVRFANLEVQSPEEETKKRHVSKVYFYSRDEMEEGSAGSPILSPPLSPPPFQSGNRDLDDDLYDCDILDSFLEHKPILPTVSTQTHRSSPRGIHSAMPVLYIGTSSLGRRSAKEEPLRSHRSGSPRDSPSTTCKAPALFPKTNGSLYDHRRGAGGSLYHPHGIITVPDTFDEAHHPVLKGSKIPLVSSNDYKLESRPDPVDYWLKELSSVQEAECTIMLQSKPLSGALVHQYPYAKLYEDEGSTYPLTSSFWAGTSKDTIRAIQARAHSISALFAKLCRQLEQKGVWKLAPLVQGLTHQIDLFLAEYNKYNHIQLNLPGYKSSSTASGSSKDSHSRKTIKKKVPENVVNPSSGGGVGNSGCSISDYNKIPEEVLHQQRILRQHCDHLKLVVSRSTSSSSSVSVQSVVDVIKTLGPTFTKLIELMLSKEILLSLDRINVRDLSKSSDLVLKRSIDVIIGLALEGNHLCRLIAKHGGVRSLLVICTSKILDLKMSRVNAFRALGTVCCVLEGIMELEEAGGIQILSSALNDSESTEDEKSEAAGLLAQVTSPFIENNSSIDGLRTHLDHLVKSLTDLSSVTKSDETFLLASAALANLTFMEPIVVNAMKSHLTSQVLLKWIQNSKKDVSIYIQDQVAAVLANMATNESCRNDLFIQGAIPILLSFLQASPPEQPCGSEDYAQMAATQRVQQKSAIAISRMCGDPSTVEEVIRLNGLKRLIELVKDESARVHSDGVLVACLATVRKISSVLNDVSIFRNLDASELVEPRLLDSFLIFSTRNESFV
ncbi:uncharacterized protein [Lepeophtheirus salmonis]|uniref:uncharacterized protein isoform X2 n=1 Tax=Lepeophtheirus salmonis TaxID=72036 RepID=UPI001AE7DD96|nr:uncharacterized protein LOC121117643 isoform X2 [Lepeophtheirus salmonis]